MILEYTKWPLDTIPLPGFAHPERRFVAFGSVYAKLWAG